MYKRIKNRISKKLRANSSDNVLPIIQPKNKVEKKSKVVHVSAFNYGNAGDVILPINVRDSIEVGNEKHYNWVDIHAHNVVDKKQLDIINKSKGVIIGDGGLFLKDTNPNNLSGWQWSCSMEMLQKIEKPIALFAVGYNRFRNQPDFAPIFTEHINLLAQKSLFFGLRNHGSIENVKKYLTEENQNKVRYQPCPTTIISKLYPTIVSDFQKEKENKQFIAINCAFDRSELRFGDEKVEKLKAIASVARNLSTDYKIKYYSHMSTDEEFLPYLDNLGIDYELVRIKRPIDIINAYSTPSLVLGMRGHAQMIPFGCGTPILSIISHEKMRWFIEDIKHPEWGVEISNTTFEQELNDTAQKILSQKETIKQEIDKIQNSLVNITNKNVQEIRTQFNLV